MKSARVLSVAFSFQLGSIETEQSILSAVECIRSMIWDQNLSPAEVKDRLNIEHTNFTTFVKSALGIPIRSHKEANVIANIKKYGNVSEFDRGVYKTQCRFTFNPYKYPSIPGYDLLIERGFWSRSNPNGVHRDHMVSMEYGFRNNIDPSIISHPANCEFLPSAENIRKGADCSITVDQLIDRIASGNFTNKTVETILVPKSEETKKKLSIANTGKIKVTDGKTTKALPAGSAIPSGFVRGMAPRKK